MDFSNSISSYYIEYALSDNNSIWSSWSKLQSYSTTLSSGSLKQKDVSAIVAKGKYIKLRIRTQGSAGSSYYSDYKESNSIQRDPKSKCQPPSLTVFAHASASVSSTATSEYVFENYVEMNTGIGTAGENVSITSIKGYYQISNSLTDWNDDNWTELYTINGNVFDSSIRPIYDRTSIQRGQYIKFAVRAIADDTSYNSDLTVSQVMRRNILPELVDFSSIKYPTSYSDKEDINLSWNESKDEDDTSPYIANLLGYRIYGRYSNNIDNTTWSDWTLIGTTDKTYYTINNTVDFYKKIENERYCEIKIVPYDMFATTNIDYELFGLTTAISIQRYDRSGVALGINNQWIDCQIYYYMNNEPLDCDVYVGRDGQWVQCDGVDNATTTL